MGKELFKTDVDRERIAEYKGLQLQWKSSANHTATTMTKQSCGFKAGSLLLLHFFAFLLLLYCGKWGKRVVRFLNF